MASAVLQYVTNKKLAKLEVRQSKFEAQRDDLIGSRMDYDSTLAYTNHLLDSLKAQGIVSPNDFRLQNLGVFLRQAQHDASVPHETAATWQAELEHILSVKQSGYVFASLFGQLVTEWLECPNEANKSLDRRLSPKAEAVADVPDDSSASFERVGRKEMYEQRAIWESCVFTPREIDTNVLDNYLCRLFRDGKTEVSKLEVTPFDSLRKSLAFKVEPLSAERLKGSIKAVLSSDLFAGKKRFALLDLKDRPDVIDEMVDVLNIEIKSLQDWSWDNAVVPVVLRRQVNGKYRFFMDEEIHQALLIEYVGTVISTRLKEQFRAFYGKAWIKKVNGMTEEQIRRRAYFLQQLKTSWEVVPDIQKAANAVSSQRVMEHRERYFLFQMPDSDGNNMDDYNGEQGASDSSRNPINTKQALLEFLTTDMHLDLANKGEFSVLQTDFRWFGPSLPFSTILTCLKFFGLPDRLLKFCKTFLEVPLQFADDGPNPETRQRKAGVPMSHCLSDAMSESILFCLDFAVNKATKGANLIRFHDDLWFWGKTADAQIAWKTIEDFCAVTGLELNREKTGSLTMGAFNNSLFARPRLPEGQVTWGFLKLDPTQAAWVVDRNKVDEHIRELSLQLDVCRSVFAFIQAWNAYVSRFFANNFARAANCHGPDHLRAVLDTFQYIQKKLFPSGSVTTHLMSMIEARFGVKDIPPGFLYFPTELGGLALSNPFIPFMQRMQVVDETIPLEERLNTRKALTPVERLEVARSRERYDYDLAKAKFETQKSTWKTIKGWSPQDCDTFFSFEEYMECSDELSFHMGQAAKDLRLQPNEVTIHLNADLSQGYRQVKSLLPGKLSSDTKWIIALYGPEILKRFGSLCIADRELLPVGLVKALRGEKVRWHG